jgi:hypothetical protein
LRRSILCALQHLNCGLQVYYSAILFRQRALEQGYFSKCVLKATLIFLAECRR